MILRNARRGNYIIWLVFAAVIVLFTVGCEEELSSGINVEPSSALELKAVEGNGTAILSWKVFPNAAAYKIYQSGKLIHTTENGTTNTYTVTELTNEQTYAFTVSAVVGSAAVERSAAVSVIPRTPLPAPSSVLASYGYRRANIRWGAVARATAYKVYQGDTLVHTTTNHEDRTYTAAGLSNGGSYTFTVATLIGAVEGEQSAAVAVNTPACDFTSDTDGNGLREICTVDDLAMIGESGNLGGSYELIGDLDFAEEASYAPGSENWINKTWRPVDNATASASSTVVAFAEGQNRGWTPIGPYGSPFTGTFDGGGYQIKNLYARGTGGQDFLGLFGNSAGAVLRSIHVHIHVYGDSVLGSSAPGFDRAVPDRVGGLVAITTLANTIITSSTSGVVSGSIQNGDAVGGLVGYNGRSSTVIASFSSAEVTTIAGSGNNVGGLVGIQYNNPKPSITSSYAAGNVSGGRGNNDVVGGIVGDSGIGIVGSSYAVGDVNGGDGTGDRVGEIVGRVGSGGDLSAAYGFGNITGREAVSETLSIRRSHDALASVTSAAEITQTSSSTIVGNRWSSDVWDFGNSSQRPVLKWVTGYSGGGFSCDQTLLPQGQNCGEIIPGQPAR